MLSDLLSSDVFQTIISGVILFIISQFTLELIIKPILELKKRKVMLSEMLLKYQNKINNLSLELEHKDEIMNSSVNLLAQSSISICRKKKYIILAQEINMIIYASKVEESVKALSNIKKIGLVKASFEK